MKKTYLFDFDGTLVDSMPTYGRMIIKLVEEYGVEYPEDIIKITTPLGFLGTAKYYIGLGINEAEEFLVEKMKNMLVKEYEQNIPANRCIRR